jgi:DNA-binding CsgD family transcriptional regulator
MGSGNAGVLRMLVSACRARPFLFGAFALYKFWVIAVFQESLVSPPWGTKETLSLPFWIGLLMLSAVICLCVAANFKETNVLFRQPWYLWIVAACMFIGAAFLFIWMGTTFEIQETSWLVYGLAMLFLSLGTIGLHIELGRIFGFLGMRQTILYNILCLLFGIALIVVVSYLPLSFRWSLLAATPFVLVGLLKKGMAALSVAKIYCEDHEDVLHIPCRFMTTSLLQGVSFGLVCGILFSLDQSLFGVAESAACVIVAVVLVAFTTLVLKLDFNRLIYQIGFLILAFGLFMFPLSRTFGVVGIMLQTVGYFYLDLVLWALGSYLIKNRRQPATWVASCPTAALMTGRTLGALLSSLGLQNSAVVENLQIYAGGMALLFVVAALFLTNKQNLRHGWGFIQPSSYEESDLEQQTCSYVAQENGLTKREEEIMLLMVQGATRRDISESLYVASNTVKTHIHGIYRKLGVHSQEDMRRLVNRSKRMFDSLEEGEQDSQVWSRQEM